MARRKKAEPPEDDEPMVDISSLIDVCFLLLIYFIVTSTIAEPESDLLLRLPSSASSSAPSDIDPAMFHVTETGEVLQIGQGGTRDSLVGKGEEIVDTKGKADVAHRVPSKIPELNDTIKLYASVSGEKAMVNVWAHPNAKAQYVIDLLNVLAKHKITKITFTQHSN